MYASQPKDKSTTAKFQPSLRTISVKMSGRDMSPLSNDIIYLYRFDDVHAQVEREREISTTPKTYTLIVPNRTSTTPTTIRETAKIALNKCLGGGGAGGGNRGLEVQVTFIATRFHLSHLCSRKEGTQRVCETQAQHRTHRPPYVHPLVPTLSPLNIIMKIILRCRSTL